MVELDLFQGGAASPEGAWSVFEITRKARVLIESGFELVWVRGEVSGLKTYRSGHWYFTLRDRRAQVRCAMFRTDNQRLGVPPAEGTEVYVEARPTVWEERGDFRLTVKRLVPTDAGGLWQLQLERSRAALERDGLLASERKRPLPRFPERIAVVTSPDGAALRDVRTVVARRWPVATIYLFPTRVQGDGAEQEICRALELASRMPEVDLLILTRGGGSREDLWTFNSERLARALAAVPVPTVTGVGHESDLTLVDLVADHRAATPSAAAETAVPDRGEVLNRLSALAGALGRGLAAPGRLGRERLERNGDRLVAAMERGIEGRRHRLQRVGATLDAMSPLKTLSRGYAVARDESGKVLSKTSMFRNRMKFSLTVSDGTVDAISGGSE